MKISWNFNVPMVISKLVWLSDLQKKKEDEKAREKELSDLFKIAVTQPKVPVGNNLILCRIATL